MPNYNAFMNKEEDEILMTFGRILAKQGLLTNPANRYNITKYILSKTVEEFRNQIKKGVIPV